MPSKLIGAVPDTYTVFNITMLVGLHCSFGRGWWLARLSQVQAVDAEPRRKAEMGTRFGVATDCCWTKSLTRRDIGGLRPAEEEDNTKVVVIRKVVDGAEDHVEEKEARAVNGL
jgi:hypothetical protein